jgi:hypothetical protein
MYFDRMLIFTRCLLLCLLQMRSALKITSKAIASLQKVEWAISRVFALTDNGILHSSSDGGTTWKVLFPENLIVDFSVSKADSNYVFVVGEKYSWMSKDSGDSFVFISESGIRQPVLHPSNAAYLLASLQYVEDCSALPCNSFRTLILSTDFGVSWTGYVPYVYQYNWAPIKESISSDNDSNVVFFTHATKALGHLQDFEQWNKDLHLYRSRDLLQTYSLIIAHGNAMGFLGEFMVVVCANPLHPEDISLMISRAPFTAFDPAVLPITFPAHRFILSLGNRILYQVPRRRLSLLTFRTTAQPRTVRPIPGLHNPNNPNNPNKVFINT